MKIRTKDYGSKDEKFVIELPASDLKTLDYIWEHADVEEVDLTRTAEEMLARWRYGRSFIRPGSIEAYEAWQQYLQD